MEWSIDQLLERLLERGECQRIEAKEAQNSLGKSALETISAFSNEPELGGGYLVLGIKKQEGGVSEKMYEIQGVSDPDALQQEIGNVCRHSFNRRIIPEVSVHSIEGRVLVVAFIPESFCRDKPVYIKSKGEEKGTFRRLGSSDVRCTEVDLDILYQMGRQRNYESEILPGVTWQDISQESVNEYRRIRKQVDPDASELELGDQELLLSLRMAIKEKGTVIPTVGGLLFFGNKAALRRELPMASRVDYIVVEGTTWVGDPFSRYQYATEYREGLMTMMPRLHAQIMSDIPNKFELKSGELERKDIPLIPREVIREALANALMHRDYRSNQPTQIIRYSNRFEFRNAGYSLKSMEELEEPGSTPRNPIIAAVFHDLNRAETKGTGIATMVEDMRAAGLSTPPIFESDRDGNAFDLILLPHHLLDHGMLEWLSQFKGMELSDAQRRALALVREIGAITNQDYRQLNGTDTLVASAGLRGLRDSDLLIQKGKGNGTYYQLSPQAQEMSSNKTPSHISALSGGLTPHMSALSGGLTPQISALHKGLDAVPRSFPPLHDQLRERISSLGQRSNIDEIKNLIKDLCAHGPLQLGQLARILDRNPKYLRDHYLTKMLRDNELIYQYPSQPAHPQQAYVAAVKGGE